MNELAFHLPRDRWLAFPRAVMDVLHRHRQVRADACEAGGVLLGRIIADSGDVIVDEVTEPSLDDVRTRFSFLRRKTTAQRRVDAAWAASNGTRIYLGEWHSHPEDRPTPSAHDLEDWRRVVKTARYEQDELFFVIVGVEEVGVWGLMRAAARPVRLDHEGGVQAGLLRRTEATQGP